MQPFLSRDRVPELILALIALVLLTVYVYLPGPEPICPSLTAPISPIPVPMVGMPEPFHSPLLPLSPPRDLRLFSTTLSPDYDFEDGVWHSALWIDATGLHQDDTFVEVNPPEGWTAYWYEGFPCSGTPDWHTGRPEVRLTQYPGRYLSGDQAAFLFTTYRCHRGGLLRQVSATPGETYRLAAYGHLWYSYCSHHSTYPQPLDWDCYTPLTWVWGEQRVGVDVNGGLDPRSEDIAWSTPRSQYGTYGSSHSLLVTPLSTTVTIFLEGDVSHPLKHNDQYWDAVSFRPASLTYLPMVVRHVPH